ncbi:MAG TPA: CapA family protein [Vicinamibacterales bacterium]|nr:CapA family protein [Vicinamibacterales bacterium]
MGDRTGATRSPREQRDFARALIDSGVDIVHGHSSHHAKGIEVYRQRLVLCGCGDFLNDYEGIGGYETCRGDLSLMYFVDVDAVSGIVTLHMVPLRMRRFSLQPASRGDAQWLTAMLERESVLEHGIELAGDHSLTLRVVTCC